MAWVATMSTRTTANMKARRARRCPLNLFGTRLETKKKNSKKTSDDYNIGHTHGDVIASSAGVGAVPDVRRMIILNLLHALHRTRLSYSLASLYFNQVNQVPKRDKQNARTTYGRRCALLYSPFPCPRESANHPQYKGISQ